MYTVSVGCQPLPCGVVPAGNSSRNHKQNRCSHDTTRNLRDHIARHVFAVTLSGQQEPDGNRWINMAARNGTDCISHCQQGQTEGKRNAQKSDVLTGKDRAAAAAKNKHKRPQKLRNIAFHNCLSPIFTLDTLIIRNEDAKTISMWFVMSGLFQQVSFGVKER